jgi:hypothetical protein
MLRTAVPEAAVNEHRQFCLLENEVRFARELGVPTPANYSTAPKNLDQPELGRLVARAADAGHQSRPRQPSESCACRH